MGQLNLCNKIFPLCFFLTAFQYLPAQQSPNIQFGVPNRSELELKSAPSDSSAEAIMLYDKVDVVISSAYNEIVKVAHQRIKILKPSALWRANIELSAQKIGEGFEKISEIEAFVYNLEDNAIKIIKFDAKQIFDEKVYDHLKVKKILLPNVKLGSVIECRYKLTRPSLVSNASNRWNFQGDIPFNWSEINITIPEDVPHNFQHHGYLPYYIETKTDIMSALGTKAATCYRFVIKDAPAFRLEEYMTTKKDYLANLDYGILSHEGKGVGQDPSKDWEQLLTFFYSINHFQAQSVSTGYLSGIAKTLKVISDPEARMNAAFTYMTKNFIWNNTISVFTKDELSLVFEKKKGNSAELNLLFVLLLNKIGIDAQAVILSTRDNGALDVVKPLAQNFNHTIVHAKINEKVFFMDVTNSYSKPNFLPIRCLNKKFCVLYQDSINVIDFEPKKSIEYTEINVQLDSLGNISVGDYKNTASGYNGLSLKQRLDLEQEKGILKAIVNAIPNWDIRNFKIDTSSTDAIKLTYSFSDREVNDASANRYLISPLLCEKMVVRHFKAPESIYPVDFAYPREYIAIVKFTLPKGFSVAQLPENISMKLPNNGGKYAYIIEVADGYIQVKSHLILNRTIYPPEEYKALKQVYDTKLKKHEELMILKRN